MNPIMILRRFVPFVLTLALGIGLTVLLRPNLSPPAPQSVRNGQGSSSHHITGTGFHDFSQPSSAPPPPSETLDVKKGTQPLRITSKPQAVYTEEARTNEVQGSVRLKVTLLASGTVGSISVVNELPDGLTGQAVAAARKLQFVPATVDGVPVSKVITIDYSFTIY